MVTLLARSTSFDLLKDIWCMMIEQIELRLMLGGNFVRRIDLQSLRQTSQQLLL